MNPNLTANDFLPEEVAPGLYPMWYGELAMLNLPAPSWVVDGLIPADGVTILSALPAHFKTWLAFDIAIQVARGSALFNHFDTEQTRVLIIDEESGLKRTRDRLQALGITEDTPAAVASSSHFKLTAESAESLAAYCAKQGIGLVIFDSLTRFHNADENNAQDMAVVMEDFRRLAQAGIAVLIIHHNRKQGLVKSSGAGEMRGSVEILAACDVQISLKRKGSVITVQQNKNRDAEELKFNLELCNSNGRTWFEYRGIAAQDKSKRDLAETAIIQLLTPDKELFQGELIAALQEKGIGQKMAAETLNDMAEQRLLDMSTGIKNRKFYRLNLEKANG